MSDAADAVPSSGRSYALWLGVLVAIALAGGNLYWTNHRVEGLQTAAAPKDMEVGHSEQTVAALQQSVQDIQANEKRLGEQISDLQQKLAQEDGDRKLLSDQLGSLSSRLDAIASANGESTAAAGPKTRRRPH